MIALILAAVSLGLSNFAAAIGIGISGTGPRTRLRVGIVFGVFEAGMPIAGLALGRGLAGALGGSAKWVSAGVLIATGAWTVLQAVIGAVSVALSLLGLELGARIGTRLGRRGEILGGLVLIAVGVAIAAGLL